jgi:hypothetical protein
MSKPVQNEDARFLELLQRWQSGEYTRADEQELYALAANDPFRQEALEGFEAFPEAAHQATLDRLRQKLAPKAKRRVLFPQMMAIAATLLLVFAAIWFFNIKPMPSEKSAVAQELPPATPPSTAQDYDVLEAPKVPLDKAAAPPMRSGSYSDGTYEAVKDVVMSRENAAQNKQTEDDAQPADFAATSPASEIEVNGPGEIVQRSTNIPPMKEDAGALADSMKKRAKTSAPTTDTEAKTKAKVAKPAPGAQPQGGWEEFQLFLINNARLTKEARANNVSGRVRLQFLLDEQNKPANFKILSSLGYGCDEAAIQLVKSAVWLRGNGEPVTVDVPFVR